MSMTDEEYTKDLVRRIKPVIEEFYGDVADELLEHAVGEALFLASCDVRRGRTAKLEYIGELRLQLGRVQYNADPWLTHQVEQEKVA